MDRRLLTSQLERHEGLRLKPYLDTVGKLTVGFGRNLDDVGISRGEAELMLKNDIDKVELQLNEVDEYRSLDSIRQTVIANMCFNLGFNGLMHFKRMWKAIGKQKYAAAAREMLDSKWANQVGARAVELSEIMRTGETADG
ncbi:glycoside hydrolase family protein (plasmid) [Marinobacter sp. M3C]|jgi:lysozyme|uniref:glycoside hydrolase family protein n=1 Tax=Marinobacter sp. M3C TaxID=2917715 RepID=UPI00200BD083|nr:glycoside hydrolase family protein [Marinobacter sp. M3C]MCL1485137.1 glycoside hydrolase family protein [Marinobacter sp.]UQG62839.1 glycoside hydrolase family protein [Marinobacter sp. M3C]